MGKKRVGKFPKAFRQYAVDRMKHCDNIAVLAKELGIHRRLLYIWRDQLEPAEGGESPPPGNARERTLRQEISRLQRALAKKTLEADFFNGALRTVKARRQRSGEAGGMASTPTSGT